MEAEHGLGFLRGFDGFLVTCGLDHHGLPAETSAADAKYPPRTLHVHPLHGRIAGKKAKLLAKRIDWASGAIIVHLVARQVSVFGEDMTLDRRYAFELETPAIVITDTVTNHSFRPARHGILYHFNVGHPFLGPGARLVGDDWPLRDKLDDGSATPFDDHLEVVDVDNSPASGGIGMRSMDGTVLRIAFDPTLLPKTALWRAFRSGIFALGLGPHTELGDRDGSRLPGGGTRCYELTVTLRGPLPEL